MKEFVIAALPWICIGVALVLVFVNHNIRSKAKDRGSDHKTCMLEGMVIGMCAGFVLGSNGISYGMLIGMAIGMCIKKK